tara:strand:- start:194 stop:433 length:240 start_codon:yes stop_codon:yes gene_type:complete
MEVIKFVIALCMYVNGSLDGHMMTTGVSDCLKLKREAERNLSESRENVIRYECGQVKAELRPDSEGNLKIYKIIEDKHP